VHSSVMVKHSLCFIGTLDLHDPRWQVAIGSNFYERMTAMRQVYLRALLLCCGVCWHGFCCCWALWRLRFYISYNNAVTVLRMCTQTC